MKGFQKKHILKRSQHNILHHEILYRAKKGFNAPISHWFTNALQELGREVTLGGVLNEWVDKTAIEKLWQSHLTHQKDEGLKLLGLTCFGLWLQNTQSVVKEDSYDFRDNTCLQ
jgi:asparagine synthase (glutamine-hydrolysing)